MTTISAPAAAQALLLDLLAIDTDTIVAERRRRDVERDLATMDASGEYQRLVRDAEAAEDVVDDVTREFDHITSDIAIAEQRIEHDRAREAGTNDAKVLKDLEHEINSLERRIDNLGNALLEVRERLESARTERDEMVAARDAVHVNYDHRAAALRDTLRELDESVSALARRRDVLVGDLPKDLVDLYEKQRERYGVGASFLQRGITGASGVQLSPSQLDEIRRADPDSVILCPDSNAILVRTAESGL